MSTEQKNDMDLSDKGIPADLGTMELRLAVVCKDSGKNSAFDMLYLGVIL